MNPQSIEVPQVSKKEIVRNFLFIATAIGAAFFITQYIGIETLRDKVASLGILGPLLVIVLKMTTIIVVPLGGGPIYVIAGTLFGFWEGLLLVTVGDALGFTVAFVLSRLFGRSIVDFFISDAYRPSIGIIMEKVSVLSVYLKARMAFVMLPELFAYGSGLTKVSYVRFIGVQMGVHIPTVVPTLVFADLLLTTNMWLFVLASFMGLLVAFVSGYWLHRDLFREA